MINMSNTCSFDNIKDGVNFLYKDVMYTKVMEESVFYNAVEFKDSDKAVAFAGGEKCVIVGSVDNAIEYCELWD